MIYYFFFVSLIPCWVWVLLKFPCWVWVLLQFPYSVLVRLQFPYSVLVHLQFPYSVFGTWIFHEQSWFTRNSTLRLRHLRIAILSLVSVRISIVSLCSHGISILSHGSHRIKLLALRSLGLVSREHPMYMCQILQIQPFIWVFLLQVIDIHESRHHVFSSW